MDIDYAYLCDNLGHLTGLPIHIYRLQDHHRTGSQPSLTERADGHSERILLHEYAPHPFEPVPYTLVLDRIWASEHIVSYFDVRSLIFFGAIRVPRDDIVIVAGPTSQLRLGDIQLLALLRQMGETPARLGEFRAFMGSIVNYPLENFLGILCFLNYALNGEKQTVREVIEQETSSLRGSLLQERLQQRQVEKVQRNMDVEQTGSVPQMDIPQRAENPPVHNTLEMERQMMGLIRAGRPDALRNLFSQPPTGQAGRIAHDPIRQSRNTFICAATLASRAAIEGGMDQEAAFMQSDLYIQKAEMLNDQNALMLLNMEMLLTFTQQVEQVNCHGTRSRFVLSVAKHIGDNISTKLTTAEIASHLHISRSQLCERFRREAGTTINAFVQEQKIAEAKRLLNMTEQNNLQISEALGYSSQGYFQNVFKQHTGSTPKEYRNRIRQ